jgi:hypothetical protein
VKEKLGAALMCLVFAVPFGGIGAGAAYVIGRMIYDGQRAEEWVRVRATVDAYGHGTVGYRYTFQGREYHGDRLGANPIGGTDNIDSWHDDMYSMLSSAKSDGKPVTVWVNPADPAESMVDRTIRWKLVMFASVFALAFGGVGVGALVMFFANVFRAFVPASAPVRVRAGSGLGATWIFTFFWNVISIPIAVLTVPDAVQNGEWPVLLVLLFPLIGLLMLWGAIGQTIGAARKAFRQRATSEPMPAAQPVAAAPATHDGFARGMIDDPRPVGDGAGATGMIDTSDDGMPPPPDPAMAKLEKLAGKKLNAEQRAQLEQLSPKSRAMVGKVAELLQKVKQAQD